MKKHLTFLFLIASLLFVFSPLHTEASKTWSSFSNVSVDKEWKIGFSNRIDTSTTKDNVYIQQNSTKIPVQIRTEGKYLYVKPEQSLNYNTAYKLIVNDKVKDVTGKDIKSAITVPFTTAKEVEKNSPTETLTSEYNMTWNIPTLDYSRFHLEGISNSKQVGRYDTRKNTKLYNIEIGKSTIHTVKALYGQPINAIVKGSMAYTQTYKNQYGKETHGTYLIGNEYVTFFYDNMKNNVVRSVKAVSKETENSKQGFYKNNPTNTFRNDSEKLMAHLINDSRLAEGLKPLIYTPAYNNIPRSHSSDMAKYNYFNHTDRLGNSALQRMISGGLKPIYSGENLAYGQYSAIYAHESLMNSEGHRRNILSSNYTHVTIGIAYNSNNVPYYTINFYSK